MAFHADVHGYIVKMEGAGIPADALEDACKSIPLFKPCFSDITKSNNLFYISFACDVKIDADEDELWLSPFERILKSIDFLYATVYVEHEEFAHTTVYSYSNLQATKRVAILRTGQIIREDILSDWPYAL
jgi:hypothetical protein